MDHTKGPWKIEWTYDDFGKESPIYGKGRALNEPIAIIPHDDITEKGEKEMKANTALILQAPNLLRALAELFSVVDTEGLRQRMGSKWVEAAQKAMREATP